jgi:acetyltransferase-like isoleucine patch superfamily enzyme
MSLSKQINVKLGKNCRIDPECELENVICGDNVVINSYCQLKNVVIGNNCKLSRHVTLYALSMDNPVELGNDVYFGPGVFGEATGGKLSFGDNSAVGHFTTFLTSSGPGEQRVVLEAFYPTELGNIHVGKYCWVGAHSLILPNVTLAEGIAIAANSVVRDVEFKPWSLYAGSPAKWKRSFDMDRINEIKKKHNLI